MRVFISSTCYDLLDLRGEIHELLQLHHFIPVMSDEEDSGFRVDRSTDSINTCLANVKDCDVFIIILSQRYGRSLAGAGFEDVSATHLEYKHAVAEKKPIFMYVRDKLEGELAIHRKNKGATLTWVPTDDDKRIFSVITEHTRLAKDAARNNWKSLFRRSTDLKQRILHDLDSFMGRTLLQKEIHSGLLPILIPRNVSIEVTKTRNSIVATFTSELENAGVSVALNCHLHCTSRVEIDPSRRLRSISLGNVKAGQSAGRRVPFDLPTAVLKKEEMTVDLSVSYQTTSGLQISDESRCHLKWDNNAYCTIGSEYLGKRYHKRVSPIVH